MSPLAHCKVCASTVSGCRNAYIAVSLNLSFVLYVVHAYDHSDAEALNRRMAVRPAHFEGAQRLKEAGHFILGGALLNPDGQMIGSMMLLDFADETQLQEWLSWEPYVQKGIWETIDIKPFRQAAI